jgi:hypothetical protein
MPRADAAGRQRALDAIKDAAHQGFLSQYGSDTGGSGPDDGSLLRKFTQDDLNSDPVYQNGLQFGLDEGTKALERRAPPQGDMTAAAR